MVMARLHLICGNCGCNDMWEWEYMPEEIFEGELMSDEDVSIICNNCATIHRIKDNAKKSLK
jgi:RNase P subunit RPR2